MWWSERGGGGRKGQPCPCGHVGGPRISLGGSSDPRGYACWGGGEGVGWGRPACDIGNLKAISKQLRKQLPYDYYVIFSELEATGAGHRRGGGSG